MCVYLSQVFVLCSHKVYILTGCIWLAGGLVTKLCPILGTPWTVACQVPLSMGFPRQECWSGLLFPSPEDLPNPGTEPGLPILQADSLLAESPGKLAHNSK